MITMTAIREEAQAMHDNKIIMERAYEGILEDYNNEVEDISITELKHAKMMMEAITEACNLLERLEEVYTFLKL